MADRKSDVPIPPARPDDDEDVSWALSTAEAMWIRGDHAEALKWLRRAAEAASEALADDRALQLAKAAADIAALASSAPAIPATPVPPPARPPAVSSTVAQRGVTPTPGPVAPRPTTQPSATAMSPTPGAPPVTAGPSAKPAVSPPRAPIPSRAGQTPPLPPVAPSVLRPASPPRPDDGRNGGRPLGVVPAAPASAPVVTQPPPPSSDSRETWPSDSLITDDDDAPHVDATRVGAIPYADRARLGLGPLSSPSPSAPALRASQALRVIVWRAGDAVHVAPAGTTVSAITVDAMLVGLDPSADLAAWFTKR